MVAKLREITLTATESNWRLFMLRKADSAFLAFSQRIFERDQYTCQYCGFCAKQHMDVVNIDGYLGNNKASNLATACPLCMQCFFLEAIGKSDFGGGTLVLMPEMTQGELNALCHVLFASMVSGNFYSTQAKNIYRSFKLRSQPVEKELGEGMSNPSLYGHLLIDSNTREGRALHKAICAQVRVLPDLSKFTQAVETWAVAGLADLESVA